MEKEKTGKVDLDIVITNFNNLPYLQNLVESIKKYTSNYNLIIVDNNSHDGSQDYLTRLSKQGESTVILNTSNVGYGAACNKGILRGTSPYILFLNSDTLVVENWFPPIKKIFEEDEKIGIISPKMINENNQITAAGVTGDGRGWNRINRGWMSPNRDDIYNEHILDCPTICGAIFFIKRNVFGEAGRFDEKFYMFYEETDLAFEVRARGYRVTYTGDVTLYHFWNKAPKPPDLQLRWVEESRRLFEEKWGEGSG